ncbi:FecR domain-containing protein [Mucilaginibacter puniceus]
MEKSEIIEILDKYNNGEATEAERSLLESWYLKHNIHSIKELSLSEFNEDLELIGRGLPLYVPVRKIKWLPSVTAAAAILIIFFSVYIGWPVLQNRLHPIQLTALHAPVNQKKQITLPDGSQIWVNAGSELRYPALFNGKNREVYLNGEAYFDIKHDADRPFIIHTGNVLTTVLGTAFNIKEDIHTHTVQVTVTRGKVSVADDNQQLAILTPNQQIIFNTASKQIVKQAVDATQVIAWQKTDLQFDDVTFAEASKKLEQRFRVRIDFANERIKGCRFSGASLNGEKLDRVLKTICDYNNATYKTQPDGSIIIDGPGCNN